MSENSAIAWTDHTWNPWHGCRQVSPGCAHCYMFRDKQRFNQDPTVVVRSKSTFRAPLRWKGPAHVFTCSWSDWFHEDADAWRAEAWKIVRDCPHLTFQILTKRPERIAAHLPSDWGDGYPNVWLGVSVELQRWTERITALCEVPAAKRFVSAEPLLGPLDLGEWLCAEYETGGPAGTVTLSLLDWVIVGGESGPKARPMDLEWARRLRDQCDYAGVPYFLKQLGGHPDARADERAVLDGCTHTAMPGRNITNPAETRP